MFDERLNEIKAFVLNSHPKHKESLISVDALLDAVIAVYDDCRSFGGAEKTGPIPKFVQRFAQIISNLKSLRLNKDDFTYIRLLAKGQFGEVSLVRGKFDSKVYAMKALRKTEMLKQQDIAFFMEERQILAALNSRWITQLFSAFQDDISLYLVMDYLPGGDISNLIMRADEGTLQMNETFVRFYVAETLMALGDLHRLNFVHRDLKPGNILLDAQGHVKLADFGSCIQLDDMNGVSSQVTVGTPDYISPEVLQANEGKGSYGKECDFWSLGITMYEMLVGDPPFYAETLAETYAQIMSHKQHFSIPDDVKLSADAQNLMKRLICDQKDRLKTVEEIKAHAFFKGLNWDKLHEADPPFHPELKNDEDVSNFAELDDEDVVPATKTAFSSANRTFTGTNLAFIGYTFTRANNMIDIVASAETRKAIMGNVPQPSDSAWEGKLVLAESECEKLRTKLLQEGKKITSLENSQTTLENELTRIRKVLTSEMEKLVQKEEQVTQLERDKKMAVIELDNVQKKYNQTLYERADLELKLNQTAEQLERDQKSSLKVKEDNRSLVEEKAALESKLEANKQKLKELQEKMQSSSDQLAELTKAKTILEVEVEHLKGELEEERRQKTDVTDQISSIESRLEQEGLRKKTLEETLTEAEGMISDLRKNLEEARVELADSARAREDLSTRLLEVESNKNASDRELVALKLKIDTINLSNSNSTSALCPTGAAAPGTSPGSRPATPGRRNTIFSKKGKEDGNQLELEIGLRRQANAEAGKMAADKLVLESQLKETQMKLAAAKQDVLDSKKIIKMLEDKMNEKKTLGRGMSKLQGSEYDLTGLDIETKAKLERKISELKKNAALAGVEIMDLKKRLHDEHEQKVRVEGNLKDLESELRDLTKTKSFMESKIKDLEDQSEGLIRDLQMAKNEIKKVSAMKDDQDEEIEELAKRVATVETERDEVQQRLDNVNKQKVETESEIESLKRRLNDLLNSHIDPEEFTKLGDECTRFHQELVETTAKYEELSIKYKRVINELDVRKREDSSRGNRLGSTGSTDDLESIENSKRMRMNNAKMKGLEQQLSVEVAKRSALETELAAVKQSKQFLDTEIEDLRKQLLYAKPAHSSTDRPSSLQLPSLANMGSKSSQVIEYKFRKLRPLLFPDGNHPVIQGWLRVRIPKNSKKTKFDWVKRYAVVKDHKLFLYEKEKDVNNTDIKAVFNMKHDLFTVNAIQADELIHLSAKEVASVFNIRVLTSNYTSMVSLDNINEDTDALVWDKRLDAVVRSIDKEKKFREATEKMINLASGDTKKRLQAELDDCMRRQKILKQEKFDVEKALKQLEMMETATIASSMDQSPIAEEKLVQGSMMNLEIVRELEKKEAYKRGVENMLSVTTNNDAKTSLSGQLIAVSQDIETLRDSLTSLDNLDKVGRSPTRSSSHSAVVPISPKKLMRKPKIFETDNSATNQELTGTSYFMALDEIDKLRWIAGVDCVRTNVRELKQHAKGLDIDALLSPDA